MGVSLRKFNPIEVHTDRCGCEIQCDFMPFHEVDSKYYWGNETVDYKELLRDLDISYLYGGLHMSAIGKCVPAAITSRTVGLLASCCTPIIVASELRLSRESEDPESSIICTAFPPNTSRDGDSISLSSGYSYGWYFFWAYATTVARCSRPSVVSLKIASAWYRAGS